MAPTLPQLGNTPEETEDDGKKKTSLRPVLHKLVKSVALAEKKVIIQYISD